MSIEEFNHLLHKLSFDVKNRQKIFLSLPNKMRASVLLHLSKKTKSQIITQLPDRDLVYTLEHLDPDEATDIIQLLAKEKQEEIIKQINEDLKNDIEILTQFDPKSAAGMMNLDYIQVEKADSIAKVSKQFRIHEKRTGRLPAILVMHTGKLIGYLPGDALGLALSTDFAGKYVKKIPTVRHNASHDEVINIFRHHPHNKIVVFGKNNNVVGIIYSDDILKILDKEVASALYDFAGVHEEESVMDTAIQKIKSRYKWLIINLATAFLAAFTVGIFQETISKYVLLAVYMPIVAGMGGNAGTQTLAILVRGIALKQIDFKKCLPALKRELIAAFTNGLINGILVASVVIIFNRDIKIAFILAMAMIINLLVAAFFGTLVPLIMEKLGKDPATSATIFITTATDVLGFLAFLGIATAILE